MRLCVGSVSVERVVQGEVGGVTAECCAHGSYLGLAVNLSVLLPALERSCTTRTALVLPHILAVATI